MTLKHFILPTTVALLLAAGTVPANAQPRHGGGSWGGHTQDRSVHRDALPHASVDHRRAVPTRPFVRGYGGPFVRTQIVRPFHGPFYAFRPRFSLGFGLFLGFPVAYPWDYVGLYPIDPYDPYASRDFGGISLDIAQGDATVTVDGTYAGIVDDFSPSSAPLTLVPGAHHVVVAKPGYRSMTFDASIAAGQVLPYQGHMQAD